MTFPQQFLDTFKNVEALFESLGVDLETYGYAGKRKTPEVTMGTLKTKSGRKFSWFASTTDYPVRKPAYLILRYEKGDKKFVEHVDDEEQFRKFVDRDF